MLMVFFPEIHQIPPSETIELEQPLDGHPFFGQKISRNYIHLYPYIHISSKNHHIFGETSDPQGNAGPGAPGGPGPVSVDASVAGVGSVASSAPGAETRRGDGDR